MKAYFKRIGTRVSALFTGGVLMREQKLFLSVVSLFFIASGLSGIFVNTFIYSCAYASGEVVSGLRAVAYYNLCMYASIAFFSVIIGIIGKAVNSRNLMFAGLVFYTALYMLLLILGVNSINYIWLLGFLSGMGNAFFNLNYSSAVTYATSTDNRSYYLSVQGIINSVTVVLASLFAGVLAEIVGGIGGYITLFIISLIIFALSIVFCFGLSYNDGKKGGTQFGNVFLFSIKNKPMRYCAIGDVISGLRECVGAFLIPLLLFTLEMSSATVGIYLFLYTLIQVAVSSVAEKKTANKNRMFIVFFACVFYAVSGFVFLAGIDTLTVFSYGTITALAQGFFVSAVFSIFYEVAYKIPHGQRKNLEILSVREFYVNVGRIIGVFTIMLVLMKTTYLIYTIIVFGLLQIGVWIMLSLASRSVKRED